MSFPRFPEALDPDEPTGKIFVFPFNLPDGASITGAVFDPVDETSENIDPSPIIDVSEVAWGVEEDGSWGVSFRAIGTGISGWAHLRCRYVVSNGPQGDDITLRLHVTQR